MKLVLKRGLFKKKNEKVSQVKSRTFYHFQGRQSHICDYESTQSTHLVLSLIDKLQGLWTICEKAPF